MVFSDRHQIDAADPLVQREKGGNPKKN